MPAFHGGGLPAYSAPPGGAGVQSLPAHPRRLGVVADGYSPGFRLLDWAEPCIALLRIHHCPDYRAGLRLDHGRKAPR